MFPAEVEQGNCCFSSQTINTCPSCGLLSSALFFAFLCFLLVVSLFKITPKCSSEALSRFLSTRRLRCALGKKYVSGRLHSGSTESVGGREFNVKESTMYIK